MPEIQEVLPKYLQIAAHIRDEIVRGDLKAGDEVPSERDIASSWKSLGQPPREPWRFCATRDSWSRGKDLERMSVIRLLFRVLASDTIEPARAAACMGLANQSSSCLSN